MIETVEAEPWYRPWFYERVSPGTKSLAEAEVFNHKHKIKCTNADKPH